MSSRKKTGLGRDAFFSHSEDDGQESAQAAPVVEKKADPPKPKKVRTTVTMYPETLASLELLKVEARKSGIKATMSDVLSEAIEMLMKKKGLRVT